MIIKRNGTTINTRVPKNALRFEDLQPGDVFRFRRGKEENIYIKGEFGGHFHINGNREYDEDNGVNPAVILYPDATIDLGPEQDVKEKES